MTYYTLAWIRSDEMRAITVDTTSGEHIILVHSDERIAGRLGNVFSRASGEMVGVMTHDMSKEDVLKFLRQYHDGGIAFPEDPLYLIMLNQLLDQ